VCRIYLMKQIVRQYSMDILKQISDNRRVRWLIPREARDDQVFPLNHNIICITTLFIYIFFKIKVSLLNIVITFSM